MSAMVSQITSQTIRFAYSTIHSGTDQRNIKAPRHWPLCGEFTGDWYKGPVTLKMFPFDDVIMIEGNFTGMGQSYGGPSAHEAILKNMSKYILWIQKVQSSL